MEEIKLYCWCDKTVPWTEKQGIKKENIYPYSRLVYWIHLNDQYVEVLAQKDTRLCYEAQEEEKEGEIVLFEDESHAVYRYKREESGWPTALKDPKELFKKLEARSLLTYEKEIVRLWIKSIVD